MYCKKWLIFDSQCRVWGHSDKMLDLYEQSLHARANIRLGEERTGSFHPQHAQQHPEPLLQQVRRVSLQVVNTLPCHYLHMTIKTYVEVKMGKGSRDHLTVYRCWKNEVIQASVEWSRSLDWGWHVEWWWTPGFGTQVFIWWIPEELVFPLHGRCC